MAVAITWYAKIHTAKRNSAGCVWDSGNLMELPGNSINWNMILARKLTYFFFILVRYNCNRYDEDEARAARDAQEKSRAALQRYLFYCNRYMNHMQSLRLEHKLYSTVKEKMEEMQQHNMSWIEVT